MRSSRLRRPARRYPDRVLAVVAALHVILSIVVIFLVLMHSGRDTGFGGLGFTPASQGGQHIVERNLTRLTIAVAALFTATTVGLYYLF
ncbi:MAG: preprotein translocase subunit SecG [Actinobacteria bacterium]|nr:preprotein translocase subunit SecG [Actinomycetota bacterium]